MASLSKINAALAMMPNELTVAAANFNIDFSLLKVEAPAEYNGVRDALTKHRKDEAEDGQLHQTARRLGALFESILPKMPNLATAYGKRVSEISAAALPEKTESEATRNLFSAHSGPDGTSIWAAATSGRSAIAVHLLACMLARMWSNTEAASLWVELVEKRKETLLQEPANDVSAIQGAFAAKQIFPRSQLRAWDASARSWIRTADSCRKLQQTQLMLIINNVTLQVNRNVDVYESIITAWTGAINMMEALLQGMPQVVRDGSILLGISSWHIYPPMVVIGNPDTKTVDYQDDAFVKGGVLTVGLHGFDTEKEPGVYWSLPLAHMQFYSLPVESRRRLAEDTTRISMQQVTYVVLGSLLSPWIVHGYDRFDLIQSLLAIKRYLYGKMKARPRWLSLLHKTAESFVRLKGVDRQMATRLFALGIRRGQGVLFPPDHTHEAGPLFDILHLPTLLDLAGNLEQKIEILRFILQRRLALNPLARPDGLDRHRDVFIAYPFGALGPSRRLPIVELLWPDFAIASVFPRKVPQEQQDSGLPSHLSFGHTRFFFHDWANEMHFQETSMITATERDFPFCVGDHLPGHFRPCVFDNFIDKYGSDVMSPQAFAKGFTCDHRIENVCDLCKAGIEAFRISHLAENFQFCGLRASHQSSEGTFHIQWDREWGETYLQYSTMSGVEVYKSAETDFVQCGDINWISLDELHDILKRQLVRPDSFMDYWEACSEQKSYAEWFRVLKVVNAMQVIYSAMSEPLLSLSGFDQPLAEYRWTGPLGNMKTNILDKEWRSAAFACIATVEAEGFDIDPRRLSDVMALSAGDSIYVAMPLMDDPLADFGTKPIQRVLGNLGRPGISMLVPPAHPRTMKRDNSSWQMVNHEAWDGKYGDAFAGTSLHLSFTEYEMPMDVGAAGLRDSQAAVVESLVSVFDKGQWISDLNILSMFDKERVTIVPGCTHDTHATSMVDFNEDRCALEEGLGRKRKRTN